MMAAEEVLLLDISIRREYNSKHSNCIQDTLPKGNYPNNISSSAPCNERCALFSWLLVFLVYDILQSVSDWVCISSWNFEPLKTNETWLFAHLKCLMFEYPRLWEIPELNLLPYLRYERTLLEFGWSEPLNWLYPRKYSQVVKGAATTLECQGLLRLFGLELNLLA